ncbi:MAG: DUF4007 family protein [Methyloprofundus sp.]|nr:DUF4007 family protein [Methyloprofundus sp.]
MIVQDDLLPCFKRMSIRTVNNIPALYKPLVVLYALSKVYSGHERLLYYSDINNNLNKIIDTSLIQLKHRNFHYAFGRMENDGVWEVEGRERLKLNKSGDLDKQELIEKNIRGGFTEGIYSILVNNTELLKEIYLYFLNTYFDESIDSKFLSLGNYSKIKGKKMALISNEGEPVTRWWVSKGLEVVRAERDIFSKSKMREARLKFSAGANRLTTIKGWMAAANLIENKKNPREYELTEFGLAVFGNDPKLLNSSTWWAFHLSLCFSNISEPYPSLFLSLENITKDWHLWPEVLSKTQNSLIDETGGKYKDSTVESLLSSIRRMFQGDKPLAELGLIEISKGQNNTESSIRLGSPILSDEIFIHALALARFTHFKSRDSVSFSELSATGLAHFLCCSKDSLRQNLQRMSQMHQWQTYFSFDYAVDLDSISFKEQCDPSKTLLLLLQNGQDTWL